MTGSIQNVDSIGAAPQKPSVLIVAMNYAPELAGTAPYTRDLAVALSRDFNVTVLSGVPHYPEWSIHDGFDAWKTTTRESGVRVTRLRHFVPRQPTTLLRLLHELTFACRVLTQRTSSPDVVIAVSPPLLGAFAALLVARRKEVPLGLIVQDIYTAGIKELGKDGGLLRLPAALMSRIESVLLQRSAGIVTIDKRFADNLRSIGHIGGDKVAIINNWNHLPEVSISRAAYREQMGWADKYVVLHAGNMGEKQGLESVVDAARAAEVSGLPLQYVLMGDGSQRRLLKSRAADVGCLEFRPAVPSDQYAQMLRAADLLLINERLGVAEMSLPSKLSSYCAAGRPIVAAVDPSGATATMLRATGAGVLIPPGDAHALNSASLDLLGDPAALTECCASGKAFAVRRFGPDSAMAEYRQWLSDLLSRTRGRADDETAARISRTNGDAA
jgi:glycosyltransferase involved in cell wall biosynthesis